MKKTKNFLLGLLLALSITNANAQKDYSAFFKEAYKNNPSIPAKSLEVLAYVQTHIANVQPVNSMSHHHGPNRYGIFALIEDGENILRNTLEEVATKTQTPSAILKTNEHAQITAVASIMNEWCLINKPKSIVDMASFFKLFIEIPDKTTVDAFAKDQFLYDAFLALNKGFSANGISIKSTHVDKNSWFSTETFRLVSSAKITIVGDSVTNGTDVYQPNSITQRTEATDYPSALWVASPNYSSRAGTAISAVAMHTTQGSYAGSISWFQNTASQVSAHYIIRSSDGQVTQMVREVNKAWHIGSENPYTIGIEHEGYVAQTGWYTTAMYNSSAAVTIDISNRNGINKTTCYNGASSSGVNLLSASIKIKGHQHFPNQTHTDPGINWNWPLYYSLLNPCGTPTGLSTTSIATTSATLNWGAVTGATSYTVEYKTTSATTYASVTLGNVTTYNLTGLTGNTGYTWRVKTNCTVGSSAVSSTATFTTLVACNITTTLNQSYIGTNSVNLNWSSISGASSYILEWKLSTASTWNSISSTNNYYTLNGLSATTAYNWRITTVCAAGNSTASTTQAFTTQAACYDAYESNNVYTSPTIYPSLNGGYVYGKICASGDIDFYKITTTTTSNINFTLSNLPANYNIETYTGTGTYIAGGYATGTTSESVILTSKPAGNYLFRVYGATVTDNNSMSDYRLQVTTSAPTRLITSETKPNDNLTVIPNPATTFTTLSFESLKAEKITVLIKDVMGITITHQNQFIGFGSQLIKIDLQKLKSGTYFIQMISEDGTQRTKQLIVVK